jgi:hypothetical protein
MNEIIAPIINAPAFKLGTQLCGLFFVVFSLALIFWTWRDADRRGALSWFWAIVVALFNLAGWAIYMVMRPPEYVDEIHERELEIQAKEAELSKEGARCPSCLKPVEGDFLICPYCMKKLKKSCISCGKPLKMAWAVCPYCKTKQVVRGEDEQGARQGVTRGRRSRPAEAPHEAPPAPGAPSPEATPPA